MKAFVLIAWILNASTGAPSGFDEIQRYPTPEACIIAMNEGRVERATDGKIRSFQCVREDALGRVTI